MTSYSSGCIAFLSCFVSCTAHGQNATHFSVGAEASGPRKARVSNYAGGHIGSPQTVSGTVICGEQPDRRDQVKEDRKESCPPLQIDRGWVRLLSQQTRVVQTRSLLGKCNRMEPCTVSNLGERCRPTINWPLSLPAG